MNIMFTWLGDLCENARDELEYIEGLSVGMVEQAQQAQRGVVVRGLGLVEERACAFSPMDA